MLNYKFHKLLNRPAIKFLFEIFEKEEKEIQLIGGCVRDTILLRDSKDIDVAAKFEPIEIIDILTKNKIEFEDYAFQYGSINVYLDDHKIQITSLREDINQIGRHTNIIYTTDWFKDAARRDFTMNALYLKKNGKLNDFFNGVKDIEQKRVKFIGAAEERIQEDYLRIFRYFRFYGLFDNPSFTDDYNDIIDNFILQSFNYLSNDVIRQEILKMFNMPFALNCFFLNVLKKEKRKWIDIVRDHFIKTNYKLGLYRCINKIDLLIN
tara:strand:+ start:30 stop:824 length:795 start_codon:yes stop_codon:yes gene_type:complete